MTVCESVYDLSLVTCSNKSVLVFSQTATLPLVACLSHTNTGVTSPCRCCFCEILTARDRQTAGFFVRARFSPSRDRQTDRWTDARPLYILAIR